MSKEAVVAYFIVSFKLYCSGIFLEGLMKAGRIRIRSGDLLNAIQKWVLDKKQQINLSC
jgi:hypothetical protein